MITSTKPWWVRSVKFMRVATPVAAIAAALCAVYAWQHQSQLVLAVCSALFGVNAVLAWINWSLLSLPKAGWRKGGW